MSHTSPAIADTEKANSELAGARDPQRRSQARVAIVGCGAVARHHARHLATCPASKLVAVVDSNQAAARAFADTFGLASTYASFSELLDAQGVEAVHITTPPASHETLVRQAIEHGVDVLVEKPVTFSHAATAELYALAAERGIRLVPDFSLFFTDLMCQAREWIAQGRLGRIVLVECAYQTRLDRARLEEPKTPPWLFELPAGPLQNFFTHPLYLTLQFTGQVRDVQIVPRHTGYLPQRLTDNLDLLIDGTECSAFINVSLSVQPTQIGLTIHGEKARISIEFESFQISLEQAPARFGSVMRMLRPSLRGAGAVRNTFRTAAQVATKRLIPYAGLKALIDRFYGPPGTARELPIPPDLVTAVAQVEEKISAAPGVWSLAYAEGCTKMPASPRSKWVAVTGGTGRLGMQVVKELRRQGFAVRMLVRWQSRSLPRKGDDLEIVFGDARNPEDVKRLVAGTEALVHMAAGMKGSREFVLESTVDATRNAIQAVREAKLLRNIYVSSMAVFDYRGLKRTDALSEETTLESVPKERSSYVEAKSTAEQLVAQEIGAGTSDWMILRPSQIFGGVGELASQVGSRIGKTLIMFGGPSKRVRLIHVQDVAQAIVHFLAPENFQRGTVLNLSHPDILLARDVAKLVRSYEGGRVVHFPRWAGLALAGVTRLSHGLSGRGPSISSRQAAYLFSECGASVNKATRLGWRPSAGLHAQVEGALQTAIK